VTINDYRHSNELFTKDLPSINEIETIKPDTVDYSILYSMSLRSSPCLMPNG